MPKTNKPNNLLNMPNNPSLQNVKKEVLRNDASLPPSIEAFAKLDRSIATWNINSNRLNVNHYEYAEGLNALIKHLTDERNKIQKEIYEAGVAENEKR